MRIGRRAFLYHTLVVAGGVFTTGLVPRAAVALSAEEAQAHVRAAVDKVLELVQSNGSPEEKAKRLEAIMKDTAAMPQIARFAAGRAWRDMSEEQQARYVEAFAHFLSTVYARRFQNYAGEQVSIGRVRDLGRKGFLVETTITQPAAAPVAVEWLVNDRPGRTVIADIVIEGVSMVATQRDEIAGMLDARGGDVEKLINDLESA